MKKAVSLLVLLIVMLDSTAMAETLPSGFLDVEPDEATSSYPAVREEASGISIYELGTADILEGVEIPEGYQPPDNLPSRGCYLISLDDPTRPPLLQVGEDIFPAKPYGNLMIFYNGKFIRSTLRNWNLLKDVIREKLKMEDGKTLTIHWFPPYYLEVFQDEDTGLWKFYNQYGSFAEVKKVENEDRVSLKWAPRFYLGIAEDMGVEASPVYEIVDGRACFSDSLNGISRVHVYSRIEDGEIMVSIRDIAQDAKLLVDAAFDKLP